MSGIISFLNNFVIGLLQQLGFYQKEATVVLLGLDNGGKTTLQYRLSTGKLQSFLPTERAQQETVTIGTLTMHTWDLGGNIYIHREREIYQLLTTTYSETFICLLKKQ